MSWIIFSAILACSSGVFAEFTAVVAAVAGTAVAACAAVDIALSIVVD